MPRAFDSSASSSRMEAAALPCTCGSRGSSSAAAAQQHTSGYHTLCCVSFCVAVSLPLWHNTNEAHCGAVRAFELATFGRVQLQLCVR
jgi:hypothetical protein